ncbi:hypothetical protein IIA28_17305 [candidate division KSB1 bacterium]|nr:hypothetical protein [candidate division KSB1 bacterium]MCH7673645.1 hypothetical protein [candidate division KSB1 bacterium]MCH7754088.1 hypothetical protein [candidate division KSB1 bacterium]MCH8018239.1 hypothetical protein [candidate division KSB1 bacterium]MCH8873458.1 hypothetical protein [candidate division KSB1 bacterium]
MSKKDLVDEIRDFQKNKKKLIPVLVVLGILGLFLPILPGVALLFFGFLLIFPREGENLLKKIRSKFKNITRTGT